MANSLPQSPRINHIFWGKMEVEGIGKGKDFKLYPGGGEIGTGPKQTPSMCLGFNQPMLRSFWKMEARWSFSAGNVKGPANLP